MLLHVQNKNKLNIDGMTFDRLVDGAVFTIDSSEKFILMKTSNDGIVNLETGEYYRYNGGFKYVYPVDATLTINSVNFK